jgi:hypothetical protein
MAHLDDDYVVFTDELSAQEGAVAAASASSCKININSAKDDAMRTSFFMKESTSDGEEDESNTPRIFIHTLSGEATLDQLISVGNIKRKHLKR